MVLAGGEYGDQTLRRDGSKTSGSDVVMRPEPGQAVSLGSVRIDGASHLTLRNMRTGGWSTTTGTHDVTFRNLDNRGGIYLLSSSDIRILGGAVGPLTDEHPQFASWPPGTRNTNIMVDGVRFHDIRRTNDEVHGECLQVAGGLNITIRNSRFENCMVFALSMTEYNGSGPAENLTIENNFFDESLDGGYYSLAMDTRSAWRNVLIRNNSSPQGFIISADGSLAGRDFRVVGNLTPEVTHGNPSGPGNCNPGIVWSHNVFSAQRRCSASDRRVSRLGFVDPAGFDLHLLKRSPARDAGAPGDFPSTDIDGQARPRDRAPDAGADEYGGPKLRPLSARRMTICSPRRLRCKRISATVRFVLSEDARVLYRVRRVGRRGGPVRSGAHKGRLGVNRLRVRAGGLGRGRYRIEMVAIAPRGGRSRTVFIRLRVG